MCSDNGEEDKRLTVDPAQRVHKAIAAAFGTKRHPQRVLFGDNDVLEGESFEDHGIEVNGASAEACVSFGRAPHSNAVCQDGARLSASTRKASVREVAAEVVALNPGLDESPLDVLTVERLMERCEGDPEDDASHVPGDLDWSNMGIVLLPPSIGDLTIDGNLRLSYNNYLESLRVVWEPHRRWRGCTV